MESTKTLSAVSRVASSALLAIAVASLPYGYFIFMRWFVCAACVFHIYLSYTMRKQLSVVVFAVLAILFNPLVPIHLNKESWMPIDLISAAVILSSFAWLRQKQGR